MIEFIFSIDYEIYGNGEGSLRDLVYQPTETLKDIFEIHGAKFVIFVEAVEFEKIASYESDEAITDVQNQIRELYRKDHEIALHLHPQWCRAKYENARWILDDSEYNICTLSENRISEVVSQSINYLRRILEHTEYIPVSFRAGNWLLQPTQKVAKVLVEHGIKIDSSVFKGGTRHQHKLDYRPALKNGYFWNVRDDVNNHDPSGKLLEIPIYTRMTPFWNMATAKRIGIGGKSNSPKLSPKQKFYWFLDRARLLNPMKFDFSRMTINELISIVERVIKEDKKNPNLFKPIVGIAHTKDLVDFETIKYFNDYLNKKEIKISTFKDVYSLCVS